MSLIADALKAAQETSSGRPEQDRRTASARRIMAPAPRRTASAARLDVPKHVQIAGAVFGLALITAAGLVIAAPEAEEAPLAAVAEIAGNSLVPEGSVLQPAVDATELAPGQKAPVEPEAAGALTGGAESGPRTGADRERPQERVATAPREAVATAPPEAEPTRVASHESAGGTRTSPAAQPSGSSGFQLRMGSPALPGGRWFEQGVEAQRRRDYGAAIQLYQRALEENPDNAEALNNLGAVYQASGDLARAREAFRGAISVQPAYGAAWSNLGLVLANLGDTNQAQAALAEAIRLDPGNHGARVNLALQYQKQGLLVEARRLLTEVVQAAPAMAEAHYALGRLLEEQADRDGAVRHYRLFLSTGAGRFPPLEAAVRQRVQQLGG